MVAMELENICGIRLNSAMATLSKQKAYLLRFF
jgi:hypothetical protein